MNNNELIKILLERRESDDLDFKAAQYLIDSVEDRSELIKDLICIANTPRTASGYIVIGVIEKDGLPIATRDIVVHPDPSEFQRIIQDRTDPIVFNYSVVIHEGKHLGIFEVPLQRAPIFPRKEYGKLHPGTVWIRKNTQCSVASPDDVKRIYEWADRLPNAAEAVLNVPTPWETFYRVCDALNSNRTFISIIDDSEILPDSDWNAFAGIAWDLIIDFNTETDTSGGFVKAKSSLSKRRSLRFTALDDIVGRLGEGTCVWVAANGLTRWPSTNPGGNWKQWNQMKAPSLSKWVSEVGRVTEPKAVTAVVFGGEHGFVNSVCDILGQIFGPRLELVFATHTYEKYLDIIKKFEAIPISINLAEVCAGLRELGISPANIADLELPKKDGGTVIISPDRARWLEEELELIHKGVGLSFDKEKNEIRDFLRGHSITWYGLNVGIDITRNITHTFEQHLRKLFDTRNTQRTNLFHWPGGGGSTTARRIAWNFHMEYPTVMAKTLKIRTTLDRVQYIFGQTNLPLLVIVESQNALPEEVDRIFDEVRSTNIPVVFLRVERRNRAPSPQAFYLEAMLKTVEAVALVEKLAKEVPERRPALEQLVKADDRRYRTPFYFGLVAFEKDFKGLEPYIAVRIKDAPEPVIKVCKMITLSYHFAQMELPIQLFSPIMKTELQKVLHFQNLFTPELQELFVETKNGIIRPVHELVAEETLKQILGREQGEVQNWRNGLADSAIEFGQLCSEHCPQLRGTISGIMRAIFVERTAEANPTGFLEGQYSMLIDSIPTTEGKQRVFEELTRIFPGDAHFWAHLGRFYSLTIKNYPASRDAHNRSLEIEPNDSILIHMAGMSLRAELFDLLDNLRDQGIPPDLETKIQIVFNEADVKFADARKRDLRSEYNYISEIQMIERVIGIIARVKGFREEIPKFLSLSNSAWYRQIIDVAENLLSQLSRVRSGENPSSLHIDVRSRLDRLYGKYFDAINGWTGLLGHADVYKPPVRRMIIRAYIARHGQNWNDLSEKDLIRVSELARQNVEEEPDSDYNLRLWLQAIRYTEEVSIERVAEVLGYRRLHHPSIDTLYYLYILKFLQAQSGIIAMAHEAQGIISECRKLAIDLPQRTRSFEWLGKGTSWKMLLHESNLGEWDHGKEFWQNDQLLMRVRGRIVEITNLGSGEIELSTGLRAFFVPIRGLIPGGFVRGPDIGREVECCIGFSYDGLRAMRVSQYKPLVN